MIVRAGRWPAPYRVNGVVRNLQAWYDAVDVRAGNAMFATPSARAAIW
ncbi:hypothetical protein [Luteimonas terrae]|uniref:Metalloendopeptidase n=1 Tax=Luteimonas terrae TaxID=1530191 RepID=A0ABU1XRZ1_9GAMM|nr:hypothetical protein [Luteimonas terrae]MDR7191535.1 putative metalloendopeptidase [Luteimonas terrae]